MRLASAECLGALIQGGPQQGCCGPGPMEGFMPTLDKSPQVVGAGLATAPNKPDIRPKTLAPTAWNPIMDGK